MSYRLAIFILIVSVGLGQIGHAQVLVLEEIVVTARKKVESLQDVPISISVTSGESIQEQGYRDLQAVAATLPAVNLSKAGAGAFMNVRGVGSGENPGFEQSVGYVMDGVSLGRSRATRAGVFDLERIEVLKGPQTTYFGANTIAGVFNVTTRSPELKGDFSGYASTSYELETEEKVFEGAINLPVSDTFALRLAGKYADSDGYIDNSGLDRKEPAIEDILFRGTALWAPTDNFEARFKYSHVELEANSALDIQLINCTPLTLPPTAPPPVGFPQFNCIQADGNPVNDVLDLNTSTDLHNEFRSLDLDVASLNLEYKIGGFTLTSVTGYYEFENDFLFDLDITSVPSLFSPSRFAISQLDDAEHISQEFRIASPTDSRFLWEVGFYYQDEEAAFSNVTVADFSPLAPVPPPVAPAVQSGARSSQDSETLSVFASASYDITDRLTATVGVRYIKVKKEITQPPEQAGPIPADNIPDVRGFTPTGGFAFDAASRSDDDILPSVDLQFAMMDDVNVYFSYGQGFKAGGYSLSNPERGVLTDFIQTFGPESVDSYELGAKGTFFNGRLNTNIALFYAEYDDRQVSSLASGATLTQAVANAATSTSKGVEIDFNAFITDRLSLRGAFAILNSEYDEFTNAPCYTGQSSAEGCIGGVQDLSDTKTTHAPEYAGSLTAKYEHPVGDYILSIEPNINFTDGYILISDANPLNTQPGFEKVNLRIALAPQSERWEIAFVGRNLNDKITSHFCQEVPAALPDTVACSPDRPATFTIQARYNF